MARNQKYDAIYESGIRLADAVLYYAPNELKKGHFAVKKWNDEKNKAYVRSRAEQIRSGSLPESTISQIADGLRIDLRKLAGDSSYKRSLPGDSELIGAEFKIDEYWPTMVKFFLNEARDGKYAAFGYEKRSRTVKSPVVRVPDDIVRSLNNSDLCSSEISRDGLDFAAVRLVAIERLPSQAQLKAKKPPKPPGPDSRKTEVIAACKELRTEEKINLAESVKSIWRKVYDLIYKRTKDPKRSELHNIISFHKGVSSRVAEFEEQELVIS